MRGSITQIFLFAGNWIIFWLNNTNTAIFSFLDPLRVIGNTIYRYIKEFRGPYKSGALGKLGRIHFFGIRFWPNANLNKLFGFPNYTKFGKISYSSNPGQPNLNELERISPNPNSITIIWTHKSLARLDYDWFKFVTV